MHFSTFTAALALGIISVVSAAGTVVGISTSNSLSTMPVATPSSVSPVSVVASATTSIWPGANTAAIDTLAENCFSSEGCENLFYLFNDIFGTWAPEPSSYPSAAVPDYQSRLCFDGSSSQGSWTSCDSCMATMAQELGIGGQPITSIHEARLAKDSFCTSDSNEAAADLDALLTYWDEFSTFWDFIAELENTGSLSAPAPSSTPPGLESTYHSSSPVSYITTTTTTLVSVPTEVASSVFVTTSFSAYQSNSSKTSIQSTQETSKHDTTSGYASSLSSDSASTTTLSACVMHDLRNGGILGTPGEQEIPSKAGGLIVNPPPSFINLTQGERPAVLSGDGGELVGCASSALKKFVGLSGLQLWLCVLVLAALLNFW